MSTIGFSASSSPTGIPPPPMTFTTPGGISASSAARASSNASSGVHGDGFSTMVFPIAIGGATFQQLTKNG